MARTAAAVRIGIRSGAVLGSVAALVACGPAPDPEHRQEGRLGPIEFFGPDAPPSGFVILLSDARGWSSAWERAALALRERGAAVVGVDLAAYLAGLRASDDGCHYVVSELEDLSKRLQRELGNARYLSPIVAGVGEGGTFAYAALAQAPAATLAGAVSIDPSPSLATRVAFCPGAPATPADGEGFAYGPRSPLPGFWRVDSDVPLPGDLAALASPVAEPGTGRGDPVARLVSVLASTLDAGERRSPLRDLPLAEIPVAKPGSLMAVIFSGDGGWRDIDKQIGEVLAAGGTPVVGVDSLRYFWQRRSPDRVARDLAAILRHYAELWGTTHAVLVGYSFGAGILPFAINRLPAPERARVVQVSLLGLAPRAAFEFHVSGWLGASSQQDPLVLPELERLPAGLVQCFYGEEEEETLCRAPQLARSEVIGTRGGHHFDGDYAALARRIAQGAERRLAEGGGPDAAGPARARHFVTTPRMPPATSEATRVSTIGAASPPGEAR